MSWLDPDTAVAIIVVWTLLRDFFIGPRLVRRELVKRAEDIAEALCVGIALILKDDAKREALGKILGNLAVLARQYGAKMGGPGGMKPPTFKEIIAFGIARKLGLIDDDVVRATMGAPAQPRDATVYDGSPGTDAPRGLPSGASSGPKSAEKHAWWRRK